MNDFLRPCNCVHPADEDCERCMEEATPRARDASEAPPAGVATLSSRSAAPVPTGSDAPVPPPDAGS